MKKKAVGLIGIVLVLIAILAAVGLSLFDQPPDPVPQTIIIDNVSAPINLIATFPPREPLSGEVFDIQVQVMPRISAARITAQVTTSGSISGAGTNQRTWEDPPVDQYQTADFTFHTTGLERGELHILFQIYDLAGNDNGVEIVQFYYVGEERTFRGSDGYGMLEKQNLEYLKNSEKISLREYRERLEKLRSGGALPAKP